MSEAKGSSWIIYWCCVILFIVPSCTLPDDATDQCYAVVFRRSVFEGHDTFIDPTSGKTNFILTILSSTGLTDQLAGYTVKVISPCRNASRVQVYQSGKSSAPNSCDADVVRRMWPGWSTYLLAALLVLHGKLIIKHSSSSTKMLLFYILNCRWGLIIIIQFSCNMWVILSLIKLLMV